MSNRQIRSFFEFLTSIELMVLRVLLFIVFIYELKQLFLFLISI